MLAEVLASEKSRQKLSDSMFKTILYGFLSLAISSILALFLGQLFIAGLLGAFGIVFFYGSLFYTILPLGRKANEERALKANWLAARGVTNTNVLPTSFAKLEAGKPHLTTVVEEDKVTIYRASVVAEEVHLEFKVVELHSMETVEPLKASAGEESENDRLWKAATVRKTFDGQDN